MKAPDNEIILYVTKHLNVKLRIGGHDIIMSPEQAEEIAFALLELSGDAADRRQVEIDMNLN